MYFLDVCYISKSCLKKKKRLVSIFFVKLLYYIWKQKSRLLTFIILKTVSNHNIRNNTGIRKLHRHYIDFKFSWQKWTVADISIPNTNSDIYTHIYYTYIYTYIYMKCIHFCYEFTLIRSEVKGLSWVQKVHICTVLPLAERILL